MSNALGMISMKSDNSNNGIPEQQLSPTFLLSGQQRALLRSLSQESTDLSRIYLGGLHVLNDSSNPDALSLAAHAIRELIEKIPEYLDVPISAQKETAKAKIREVEASWEKATANSECHNDGRWGGKIDGSLRKLLAKLDNFFKWFQNHYPRRRDEIGRTLSRMEASDRNIPPPLQELNVATWLELRDFFISVAHHRKHPSREDFLKWLDALERFLLDRLAPRTFEDFEQIDIILREEVDG